ncbi:hypothetical protein UCRNP2_5823 [Neofusicoccum parvum UCRNP2]|uniref:Transmembrane protein n=1 Tax=Botryosphaeria parva (strain UCR-NP2) TaxID=1287680 RepID=R1GGP2_BOTPV|nr:hypothetical protein UCRNP2_5823 [Neofusicoccum parvum UCRNP2]
MLVRYQHWVNPQAYEITRAYTIPLNVGLFVFGCWWQLLLSTEAVSAKNNLQLFALCICNGCLFAVNAMRYEQTSDTATEMLTGADAGVGAEPLVDSSYSYWPVVKPALITSTAWVGVFLVLMKLGVYFFIAFLVLYGVINVHYAMPEFGIVMALIPAALLQISLAVWCVRKEIYVGMAFVIILFCAASAYLFSRIAAMFGSGARAQTLLKDEMVLFAMVAFCFVFATLCTAIKCTINFKHGLKPIFERQEGLQKLQDEDSYRLDVILRTNGSTDMLKSKRFTLD